MCFFINLKINFNIILQFCYIQKFGNKSQHLKYCIIRFCYIAYESNLCIHIKQKSTNFDVKPSKLIYCYIIKLLVAVINK